MSVPRSGNTRHPGQPSGSLLPAEVEAGIEVYTPKEIVCRELAPAIIVGMEYRTHAGKPPAVVPYQTETSDTIEVDVVELEVAEGKAAVRDITCTSFVRQG